MGNTKRGGRKTTEAPAPRKWRKRDLAILAAALAVGALIGIGWWIVNHRHQSNAPLTAADARDGDSTSSRRQNRDEESRGVLSDAPEFGALEGKWVRADGGYVLDINSVDEHGTIDAAYLNPRPIHVAKAEASRDGEAISVFVELRDVNYPGSTYNLVYQRQSDQLVGVYFQAVQGQQFDVVFDRVSDP